ncbi:hypothetical protein BGZ65_007175, partial [Modicella reniformis]
MYLLRAEMTSAEFVENDPRLDDIEHTTGVDAPTHAPLQGPLPLQALVDNLHAALDKNNLKIIYDSLSTDFSIHDAGHELAIRPADRIMIEDGQQGRISFRIMDKMFRLWREEHEISIGTKFFPNEQEPNIYSSRP